MPKQKPLERLSRSEPRHEKRLALLRLLSHGPLHLLTSDAIDVGALRDRGLVLVGKDKTYKLPAMQITAAGEKWLSAARKAGLYNQRDVSALALIES